MASVQEIIRDVQQIKKDSEELATMTGVAGQRLVESANDIAAMVQGSRSGMDAVMALNVASSSLASAAASILGLGNTCDKFINNASK